ncbi:MAG: Response regulator PleD [Pelotomaculum sp. PtaB.Bin104]|nr:MAG: Response regulator PleD [Pelotomaculum sp. PtaB.Bin104]
MSEPGADSFFWPEFTEGEYRDHLTNIPNRRAFDHALDIALKAADLHGEGLGLVILDIDHFKKINDSFGHQAGDAVLKAFTSRVSSSVRGSDFLARYGGEEFALIAMSRNVFDLGERVRQSVENSVFKLPGGQNLRVTCSFGCALYPNDANNGAGLITAADDALYAAKHGGRNRGERAKKEERRVLCVIAADSPLALHFIKNLKKVFGDWDFEVCTRAEELNAWSERRPDVLVVSRCLPGETPEKILKDVPTLFSASHIVLVVGPIDEKCRIYMKNAQRMGLNNIVTGRLPGDPPYNIFVALTNSRDGDFVIESQPEEEIQQTVEVLVTVEQLEREREEENGIDVVDKDEVLVDSRETREKAEDDEEEMWERPATAERRKRLFVNNKIPRVKTNPMSMYAHSERDMAPVATSVSNKGGVGKTTTTVSLAVALSMANLRVSIADLNLGGPNVAAFFNLNPTHGIEMLSGRRKGLRPALEQLLVNTRYENLKVLPGPVDKTVHPENLFGRGELAEIINVLKELSDVVIVDTPPEFWTRSWLAEVFEMSDLVLAVVDQSKFSEEDTSEYAPHLLSMGVTPERIKIVLNKFSPRLHNARIVEKAFCAGFKKGVNPRVLPKVTVTIPHDWDAHGLKGYKGEVVGLEDAGSQWHRLAGEVARMAGREYAGPVKVKEVKKMGLFGLLTRRGS